MKSIELLWQELERLQAHPAFKRIDDTHPCDLYAAVGVAGEHGLFLVSSTEPPAPQSYEAVEITRARRQDGKWVLALKLHRRELLALFAQLCNDLIQASRRISAHEDAGIFLLSRVARWRRLLELGTNAILSIQELRGLIGELTFLQLHAVPTWKSDASVDAWVGPLDAPQDFSFPDLSVEVKTIRPGSSTVKISSTSQLDIDSGRLLLAVVPLSLGSADEPQAISATRIVDNLRQILGNSASAVYEFNSKLAAAGYRDNPAYATMYFCLGDIRFFEVRPGFPRLTKHDLPSGVTEARYDIDLAACTDFELTTIRRGI